MEDTNDVRCDYEADEAESHMTKVQPADAGTPEGMKL